MHTYFVGESCVSVHNNDGCKITDKAKNEINILGKGSTGRADAKNFKEQLAMKEVLSDPLKYSKPLKSVIMNDKRWLTDDGWIKMSKNVNGVEVHYVYNTKTKIFDDFKFK